MQRQGSEKRSFCFWHNNVTSSVTNACRPFEDHSVTHSFIWISEAENQRSFFPHQEEWDRTTAPDVADKGEDGMQSGDAAVGITSLTGSDPHLETAEGRSRCWHFAMHLCLSSKADMID